MSRATTRLGLLVAVLFVFVAAPRADGACNETCRQDIARCRATECAGAGRATCRRRCKPAAIRTLAYVLNECRRDAPGMGVVRRQALRIRRGDREPITVVEFSTTEPQPDPPIGVATQGLCHLYGESRNGPAAVVAGALQRLGVSPDGSGVVFEVNNEFALSVFRAPPLPPDQQGLFFVRADGSGRRRLGPASRDPSFRF